LESMMDLPVSNFMRRKVYHLKEIDTVKKAASFMKKHKIGSVFISKKGKSVGIVTEKDIIYKVVVQGLNPADVKLETIMSTPLISVTPKTTIREALDVMSKKNIRRVLVVDGDKPVGVLIIRLIVGDMTKSRLHKADLPKDWLHRNLWEVAEDAVSRLQKVSV
jgi:CBS domain-containing protein